MSERGLIYRHRIWVRITHWLNLVCMTALLMSGLQIFNAHPALYWGERSRFDNPILAIAAERDAQGRPMGVTAIAGRKFETTGLLGLSGDPPFARAFPAWATLPSGQWLALGRRWHFFFAWILVAKYVMRIELVESFSHIRGGRGGYWEDQGYEWYAGI